MAWSARVQHFAGVHTALSPVPFRDLPRLAATLYPGRKHPFMWTHFELQLVQMTLFELVFRQQLFNVPATMNADAMSASGAQTRL